MPSPVPPVEIVLVDTRHAGNIGAVCRLMKNFGLRRLTLVNPTPRAHLEAVRMAQGALDLLETCAVAGTLEEALAPLETAYAVTRHPRTIRKEILTPEAAAGRIATAQGRVGLVFGSEKWGLSTEQVRQCDASIAIPTCGENPSLNLAQAAAVVIYHAARAHASIEPPRKKARRRPAAGAAQRRALFHLMAEALEGAGYFVKQGNRRTLADVEDIFNRASLDTRDAALLAGMFRVLRRAVNKKK